MQLEGTVTNVGAFVDVGVHQDGPVHVSQLADRFVKDPYEVVSPPRREQTDCRRIFRGSRSRYNTEHR